MSEGDQSDKSTQGMRAVILVGGYGTRLRPLTLTMPKPLVPFCNKPIIVHQVEALRDAGVTEVILAVAYRSDAMKKTMEYWAKELGVSFAFSLEEEPLGTAGPLALARDILLQDDQPFFVLNADITCRFPLRELLSFHQKSGKEGTIAVTKVTEWQKYGVVVFDEATGLIDQFVEKPRNFVGDRINAGIYVFNKSVLNRIKVEKTSIETQVFPQMASAKQLCAFVLEGFWMDIGVPKDYIEGVGKYLRSLNGTPKEAKELYEIDRSHRKDDFTVIGCVIIDPTAKIGQGCVIGPFATIGPGCVIGPASRIKNSAILEGSKIGNGTFIDSSIIGWKSRVGSWCRVVNNTVLGEDVEVGDELFLNGTKVLPNKSISHNYHEPEVVM
ncbi:mannose-1-phosphate guanyltransferase [Trypanosoma rangeli SC58]|uniref:mannose-1-phosphate guanylyltransferase n=1 Tax=Trypanosoma rangeli SC58 TaxID=429131 RepID=A0A061JCL3_TRYRA|nr:mannose-1-phosphate guanyltransferase [Trypanosoma rangeli SC58]